MIIHHDWTSRSDNCYQYATGSYSSSKLRHHFFPSNPHSKRTINCLHRRTPRPIRFTPHQYRYYHREHNIHLNRSPESRYLKRNLYITSNYPHILRNRSDYLLPQRLHYQCLTTNPHDLSDRIWNRDTELLSHASANRH